MKLFLVTFVLVVYFADSFGQKYDHSPKKYQKNEHENRQRYSSGSDKHTDDSHKDWSVLFGDDNTKKYGQDSDHHQKKWNDQTLKKSSDHSSSSGSDQDLSNQQSWKDKQQWLRDRGHGYEKKWNWDKENGHREMEAQRKNHFGNQYYGKKSGRDSIEDRDRDYKSNDGSSNRWGMDGDRKFGKVNGKEGNNQGRVKQWEEKFESDWHRKKSGHGSSYY